MGKVSAAIVGSGNIGTDLLAKLLRSTVIEPRWMVGIDPDSEGSAAGRGTRARDVGRRRRLAARAGRARRRSCSRRRRRTCTPRNAAQYAHAGMRAVDLTPAAVGPYVVPVGEPLGAPRRAERQHDHLRRSGDDPDRARGVPGARRSSTARSSRPSRRVSAGPGTRANIDEFTQTTGLGVERLGGARRGKAIIVLNPAEPPIIMRDTIFCAVAADADEAAITESIEAMVAEVATYVPGYRLRSAPQFDETTIGNPCERAARGRGLRRLPAAVRRQPRHHDRGRDAGRRGDRPLAPRSHDMSFSERPRRPHHRLRAARRLPRQPPPVHRGRRARRRRRARRGRHAGHRGHPRRRTRRILVHVRVQPHRRARADPGRGRDRHAVADRRADAPGRRRDGRHPRRARPRRVDRAHRDALHRSRHRGPALPARARRSGWRPSGS